ncbi:MAG: hypothetical protein EU542_09055, partial [Promethearchaeota archaeon]
KKIVLNTFSEISDEVKFFFNENQNQFYVVIFKDDTTNRYPSIFFVSKSLIETFKKLNNKSRIVALGIYTGFMKHGQFYLSIEGAEFLNNNHLIPKDKKIYVKKDVEKSILYGNHIDKMMISSLENFSKISIEKGKIIFLFSEINELLSISLLTKNIDSFNKMNESDLIATNLIDKGYYLRKKQ